jgi:hypothetical protein
MLMRPKHPLVRLQALNMSGDLMGSFTHRSWCKTESPGDTWTRLAPVTSFLFLRYRLQGFQVGAEVPLQDRMIIVIS